MCTQCNIDVFSRNNCSNGKIKYINYYEPVCTFVLVIRHADYTFSAQYFILNLSSSTIF